MSWHVACCLLFVGRYVLFVVGCLWCVVRCVGVRCVPCVVCRLWLLAACLLMRVACCLVAVACCCCILLV